MPKHLKWMGWTLNFARPSAIPVLLGMMALLVLPFLIAILSGRGAVVSGLILAASIVVVCLLSAHFSSSKRWA